MSVPVLARQAPRAAVPVMRCCKRAPLAGGRQRGAEVVGLRPAGHGGQQAGDLVRGDAVGPRQAGAVAHPRLTPSPRRNSWAARCPRSWSPRRRRARRAA